MLKPLALLILLVPVAASAEPIEALKPMAFLAGHCWKGQFADSKQTDEHCFQWLYDGRALRDNHTVRTPGSPDYVGETTYYFDSVAKRVDWLYLENLGGMSRGTVQSDGNALVFPPTEYVGGGQTMTYRVRWTPVGKDAYEAWSETKTPNGWTTMFRMTLTRTDARS